MTERARAVLNQLSVEERTALTAGIDAWNGAGIPRLNIRGLKVTDGPNGARGSFMVGTTSACTPCGTALGATWNPELVREVGVVLGEECGTKSADLLLAPTVNLHRSPLAGRNFECFSEDPLLTARLATAYVAGVQSTGVGCAIKHFVANDSEFQRHTISSVVDERTLRELYLVPFEAAVREADVVSVMAAYNRLNGTYCAEHEQLIGLLREWEFGGFVISDWWGTKSTIETAQHGVDLEMPGPPQFLGEHLLDAIRAGRVNPEAADAKALAILSVMDRLGVLDDDGAIEESSVDSEDHREILRAAAREAVVLLRNEPVAGAPALPLHPTELNRLAVIGPQADVVCVQGGGSASVTPHRQRTILQAITERFGSVEIVHERGTNAHRTLPPLDLRWLRNPRTGEPGVHVEYFEGRGFDTPLGEHEASTARFQWLGVPWPGVPTGNFSARITTEVVVNEDVMMEFGLVVGGSGRVALDGDTVLDMWDRFVPGEAFFGLGSAQISVEVQLRAGEPRQLTAEFACMEGVPMGAMILGGLPTLASDGIERAAAAAASSDAAVVVVGLNQDWETEGSDRASWDLPGDQVALIRAVAAAQPRTVVLVQAGSPVDLDWEQEAAAVAQVWYLGQEGPDALAELLSGDHSPSGHLPTTLPQRFLDHPAVENYPGSFGEVVYGESVFVGYRFYDHREIAPRHRFGFGLSYTEFELSDLEVSEDGDRLTLGVTIANVGGSRGSAVVQVYVAPPSSDIPRPPRELKGFAKCELGAAETARVHIELPPRAFQHWDPERSDWATVAGEYEIEVGQFAGDRALAARVSK